MGTQVDVVVVGGGLAGLTVAVELSAAGRSVVLFEAGDDVGGRVRTDRVDGFQLDRGFQVLLTAYPELERLVDLEALDLHAFDPGASVHLGDGRFCRVGDPLRQPSTALSSLSAPVGTLADKLRLLRLLLRLRASSPRAVLGGPDRTTEEALRLEGFSDQMIDRFFRPLFGGVQLDADLTASRRMFDVVLRCLAVGSSAVPAAGMGALPHQLAGRLAEGTVRLEAPVSEVRSGSVTLLDGERVEARQIVVATEGPVAAQLLGLPAVASRPVAGVWFVAPVAPVADRLILLDGARTGPALNVAVMSNVAPSYSPDGRALIVAACPTVDRAATEGVPLHRHVTDQLRGWFGAEVQDWEHLHTHVIAHGQPDSRPPFSPKRRVVVGDGVFVCGDHRDTPSIQGAMHSGRRCAAAVLAA